jgi:glutathione synthase
MLLAALALSSVGVVGVAAGGTVPSTLVSRALGWANSKGLQVSPQPGMFVHAPLSLTPFPLSAAEFDKARALAPLYNELVEAVASDEAWLLSVLEATLASDPFTGRLARLLCDARASGGEVQPLHLGIHRSDYMLDEPARADGGFAAPRLLQIELNTIASSFGCLSARVSELHAYVCSVGPEDVAAAVDPSAVRALGAVGGGALPSNGALTALPDALAAAHAAYLSQAPPARAAECVVLFVVQPGEANVGDQQMLELALWERHGVRTLRRTLAELAASATLEQAVGADGAPRPRLVVGGVEVSVAYLRAGYGPNDYPTEREWEARLTLERSAAIKCPTVAYQLAGTKKVQQLLAEQGVLERFVARPDAARALRATFAGLYSLQTDAEYAHALELTRADPDGYVLKPQREGGGNNIYGAEAAAQLAAMRAGEREGYILMQRIRPRPRRLALARRNEVTVGEAVCELGVFGVYLGGGGAPPRLNAAAGHLLRTKLLGTDEGGVAAGFAVLSSPVLIAD